MGSGEAARATVASHIDPITARRQTTDSMIKALTVAVIILAASAANLPAHSFATNTQQDRSSKDLRGQKGVEIRDFLIAQDKASYRGFVVRRLHKQVKLFNGSELVRADASYIKLRRDGKTAMKFDGIYHPLGNGAEFGFLSLLGGKRKQLLVSLDTSRTGTQWIVDLGQQAHVIYDGRFWGAGRETDDFGIVDVDGDGVYEVTGSITDFYELHDKMSMSQIPLPVIVFKYDKTRRRYVPANTFFRNKLVETSFDFENVGTNDEFNLRSIILGRALDLIYAGKKNDAWRYFERVYKLDDKVEIKRLVNTILASQPVYKFIYNRRKHK